MISAQQTGLVQTWKFGPQNKNKTAEIVNLVVNQEDPLVSCELARGFLSFGSGV